MINFDEVDFSERRSEEVISFFWRSVYIGCIKGVLNKWIVSINNSYWRVYIIIL